MNTKKKLNIFKVSKSSQPNKNCILGNKTYRGKDNSLNNIFSLYPPQSVEAKKSLQSKNFLESYSNNYFTIEEQGVIEESLHTINYNMQNTLNNINTKLTMPNTREVHLAPITDGNENFSPERSRRYKQTDNVREIIKNKFFRNIVDLVKEEFIRLKMIDNSKIKKIIERMKPLEDNLKLKNKFTNKTEKVKDIFYTEKNPEFFYKNKNKKTKTYIPIEQFKKNNENNKEIINQIEDMYEKIEENEYQKIKDNIIVLYKIFNINLRTLFIEYIKSESEDKKIFKNFKTLEIEVNRQKKIKKRNTEYIKIMTKVAFNLAFSKKIYK